MAKNIIYTEVIHDNEKPRLLCIKNTKHMTSIMYTVNLAFGQSTQLNINNLASNNEPIYVNLFCKKGTTVRVMPFYKSGSIHVDLLNTYNEQELDLTSLLLKLNIGYGKLLINGTIR